MARKLVSPEFDKRALSIFVMRTKLHLPYSAMFVSVSPTEQNIR